VILGCQAASVHPGAGAEVGVTIAMAKLTPLSKIRSFL